MFNVFFLRILLDFVFSWKNFFMDITQVCKKSKDCPLRSVMKGIHKSFLKFFKMSLMVLLCRSEKLKLYGNCLRTDLKFFAPTDVATSSYKYLNSTIGIRILSGKWLLYISHVFQWNSSQTIDVHQKQSNFFPFHFINGNSTIPHPHNPRGRCWIVPICFYSLLLDPLSVLDYILRCWFVSVFSIHQPWKWIALNGNAINLIRSCSFP